MRGARGAAQVAALTARWFVYVLGCADGTLYTGIARDVRRRVDAHAAGKGAKYTRGRGPFAVLAARACASKGDALRLELAMKKLSRFEKGELIRRRGLAALARSLGIATTPARTK